MNEVSGTLLCPNHLINDNAIRTYFVRFQIRTLGYNRFNAVTSTYPSPGVVVHDEDVSKQVGPVAELTVTVATAEAVSGMGAGHVHCQLLQRLGKVW